MFYAQSTSAVISGRQVMITLRRITVDGKNGHRRISWAAHSLSFWFSPKLLMWTTAVAMYSFIIIIIIIREIYKEHTRGSKR